jgi:ElaB/YqjD/DUF883 family membrane-anchored ribosome-binding protein
MRRMPRTRGIVLQHFERLQQAPKPPSPEPGYPPGNVPPPPPEIPVPDPAPPPVENPGDMPLPPITDPDVVTPGEPNPGHTPTRVEGILQILNESMIGDPMADGSSSNQDRNLSSDLELESITTNTSAAIPLAERERRAAVNDKTTHKWRIAMASIKPVEEATQDFSADLAALRDDVTKLTSSVSEFIRSHTVASASSVADAVDSAKQKISDSASKAQDRVTETSADLESTIERNPLAAVLIALVVGLIVGLVSRGRK